MIATMALGLLYLMLVRGLCLLTLLAHSDAQERRDPDAAARGRGTAPHETRPMLTGPARQDLRAVGRHQDVPPLGRVHSFSQLPSRRCRVTSRPQLHRQRRANGGGQRLQLGRA
jgi:hypothetical protein